MNACVDYYYSDILKQLSFYGLYLKEGDTIATLCGRAQERLKGDELNIVAVGTIVMRQRFGRIQASRAELQYLARYHEETERRIQAALGNLRYFWQRILLNSGKPLL